VAISLLKNYIFSASNPIEGGREGEMRRKMTRREKTDK
jgi:hypothetical protein